MHICTDKALFAELRIGKLIIIRTKSSPIQPQGIRIVKFKPYINTIKGRPQYNTIVLKEYLYIPTFPINIVSSYHLYNSGGILIKNKLYNAFRKLITLLNFKGSGFHIQLRRLQPPKTNYT